MKRAKALYEDKGFTVHENFDCDAECVDIIASAPEGTVFAKVILHEDPNDGFESTENKDEMRADMEKAALSYATEQSLEDGYVRFDVVEFCDIGSEKAMVRIHSGAFDSVAFHDPVADYEDAIKKFDEIGTKITRIMLIENKADVEGCAEIMSLVGELVAFVYGKDGDTVSLDLMTCTMNEILERLSKLHHER